MGKNRRVIILSLIILLFSLINFFYFIFSWRKHYLSKFDVKWFKKQYENSQWIIPNSKTPISDETLFAYAGYQYTNGMNPILINPETAPLGKYLIGWSIKFFGNQNVVILMAAVSSLILIFLIIYHATKSHLAASLGVLLTTLSTSFKEQLIHLPQLDMFQLLFLLSFILAFYKYKKDGGLQYIILGGIFLGGFISVKFFLLHFLTINSFLFIFYLINRKSLAKIALELFLINLVGLTVYLLSYSRFFILGGNLRGFLGAQKWIALFYADSSIDMSKLYGNYLSLIFLNKWKFWFNDYPTYPYKYWNIFWPIIFVLGIFSAFRLFIGKGKDSELIIHLLVSFLIIYNIFLFITPIYPRYLLLLFVPLNILIAIYLGKNLEVMFKNSKF